ncbi:P-loop containing nucleoside triphosphate hydrolase protein, partial [Tricholoma matsutake]
SVDMLTHAHEAALKARNYNHIVTQESIENKFKAVFDGKAPYSWQIDVTEALLLGLDCVVIAGTGSGKTMPFGMLLLLDKAKDKIVIIISPLNELEAEQAERFCKLHLTATAVNANIYNLQLHKHPKFSKLMCMPEFMQNVFAFIIIEAHCISQWGDMFRKKYAELGKLWSFVPDHIPILAASATMPHHILDD